VSGETLPEDSRLVDERGLETLWDGPRRVWFFAREKQVAPLRRAVSTAVYTLYDDGDVALYSNRETPAPR
jgi:hypothetical protein